MCKTERTRVLVTSDKIWYDISQRIKFSGKGMMKDGAESVGSVLFIVRFYGVIERLPVMG